MLVTLKPKYFNTNLSSGFKIAIQRGMAGCPKNFSSAVAIDARKRENDEVLRKKKEQAEALAARGYE